MTTPCAVCGHPEPRELAMTLVHWSNALPGMQYEHVMACIDRRRCWARVQAARKPWPLVESKNERASA